MVLLHDAVAVLEQNTFLLFFLLAYQYILTRSGLEFISRRRIAILPILFSLPLSSSPANFTFNSFSKTDFMFIFRIIIQSCKLTKTQNSILMLLKATIELIAGYQAIL